MLSNEEIIKKFQDFRKRFTEGWQRTQWLQTEVRENYSAIDGFSYGDGVSGQWESLDYAQRISDKKPCYQINKLARVVDSIAGFQVQNRSEVNYVPREVETKPVAPSQPGQPPQPPQMGDSSSLADVVNDGLDFIKQEARTDFENSTAFNDMLICGIGAVDDIIVYDEDDDGVGKPSSCRRAPYLLMWDVAARKKNLTDGNACASASLHDKDALLEEINADRTKEEKLPALPDAGSGDDFIRWFSNGNDNLCAAYDFQWRVKEAYWQIQNPVLQRQDLLPLLQADGSIEAASARGIDLAKDEIFSINMDEKKAFKEAFEKLGLEFKAIKQRRYRYYRANIVGNEVISASENYSQKGFSLSFMTGKWSETRQCWYGVVSVSKDPQRLLNKAISDMSETLYISAHGGVIIESSAVGGTAASLQAFKETFAKQREVTILADGAISGNRFMLKPQATLSPATLQTIEFAERSILECPGLTQEFLGVADGGNQAALLQAQRVRQGLAVLATYSDSHSFFLQNQATNHVEMLRVLSENSGGLMIRNLSGAAKSPPYIKLLKDQIAIKYDLVVQEAPKTPDIRQRENEVLLQIMDMIQKSGGNPQPMIPLVIENQEIHSDKIDEILAATMPPPPPQPDPVNQGLIVAQTNSLNADAKYKESQAKGNDVDLLGKFKELRDADNAELDLKNEKLKAEIKEIISQAVLNYAKAGQSHVDAHVALTQPTMGA